MARFYIVPFLFGMREKSRQYGNMARRLIKEKEELADINEFDVRIVYLSDDKEKKKNRKIVLADCEVVNEKYQWAIPYDFMITVYEPNVIGLTEEQLEILMYHELLHVGIDATGDEPKFYVVPHDIEEFEVIIEKYGLHWDRKE